jgi:uncharacterized protein (DUF608 family)
MNWPFVNDQAVFGEWIDIKAEGFQKLVPGCVFMPGTLESGIPLGGLGTGYFTLEGSGKIGYHSIFNNYVPPLTYFKDWLYVKTGSTYLALSDARVHYWGHYPVADMIAEFESEAMSLGIRAFCPFIVGNAKDSNLPAVLFEIEIENNGIRNLDADFIIRMPVPQNDSYAEVFIEGEGFRIIKNNEYIEGIIHITVEGGRNRRIRFVYSWYAPYWRDSGNEAHVNYYNNRYKSACSVARDVMSRFDILLARTLGWQTPYMIQSYLHGCAMRWYRAFTV